MGYLLFLVSILVSSFYYFRMARKFESFDVQVTEELQKDMNTLITDFNQTASQNIGILEDRLFQGKALVEEITEQLSYLKKLRDSLQEEIRDYHKKKLSESAKDSSLLTAPIVETSLPSMVYKRTQKAIERTKSSLEKRADKKAFQPSSEDSNLLFEAEDILEVNPKEALIVSEKREPRPSKNKKREKSEKLERKRKPSAVGSSKGNEMKIKELILLYNKEGKSIEEISQTLSIPKGEVELTVRLFRSVI